VTLVLARVDDRLVHGQVMEAWAPGLRADAVVVADDEVCADPARRRLIECLSCREMEVTVSPLAGLAGALAGRSSRRVILLFSSLGAAAAAVEAGLRLDTLNVGNVHHPGCECVQLAPSIFLDEADLKLVERLRELGVRVQGRDVPEGRAVELPGGAPAAGKGEGGG
jgi:mannose/fructose/N-acetylgalactosamine-specific phosphotransferase system component IIB